MTKNPYDILLERGYLAQSTDHNKVKELLSKPGVRFYIGIDPTADSMHAGHFSSLMALSHLQKGGHFPILLMGGGTGLIGDPSGRQDLRKVLTEEQVKLNIEGIRSQLSLVIDMDKAKVVNNADWLRNLNYIDLLREVGTAFSVNRMLSAECYKSRYEHGLTFLEFNYMIMQSFDFYHLCKTENCILQIGGDDQWSNILSGSDLIRRKLQKEAHALTFKLLTNYEGQKMGKTAKGAVWLDEKKCSVFDFYQYWRNTHDMDVIRFMKLLTFMELSEIAEYEKLEGQALNIAKKRLAFEITQIVHGTEKAQLAQAQAESLFEQGQSSESMPSKELSFAELEKFALLDLLLEVKLIPSRAEGRRLIEQGGITLNGEKLNDIHYHLQEKDFPKKECIVKKGKKSFFRFLLV